ncbi:MAG TPA: helix-turn-helix transcriptional regulator [Gammaproteobacteria bacterium]|nr:helix-turn-helix transcriptional regulator [Gammaproteobacteria bacterium]
MADARLGNRLKERRTEKRLTQAELAKLAGVSRKTINTVENGVFVPSVRLALILADRLDTTVETLFYLTDTDL